ncbi:hypothetical protein ACIQXD_33180 [Streptomyces uncialis]|uniref:hypothetical protein n=1 Tax=Streptomyces uncialis TaxID=1048205 RepID=UPI0037FBDB04
MDHRKILITALVTAMVFVWSVTMAAMGHAAAIAWLAPALGLTVRQIVRASHSRTRTASGHRVTAAPEREDSTP